MKTLLAVVMACCLTACAGMGVAPPTSPSQGFAYAYGVVAGLRTSAAQALMAQTITVAQAQSALTLTDQARALLDAGEVLLQAGGDTTTIAGDLAAATAVISQVQSLLPKTPLPQVTDPVPTGAAAAKPTA